MLINPTRKNRDNHIRFCQIKYQNQYEGAFFSELLSQTMELWHHKGNTIIAMVLVYTEMTH